MPKGQVGIRIPHQMFGMPTVYLTGAYQNTKWGYISFAYSYMSLLETPLSFATCFVASFLSMP